MMMKYHLTLKELQTEVTEYPQFYPLSLYHEISRLSRRTDYIQSFPPRVLPLLIMIYNEFSGFITFTPIVLIGIIHHYSNLDFHPFEINSQPEFYLLNPTQAEKQNGMYASFTTSLHQSFEDPTSPSLLPPSMYSFKPSRPHHKMKTNTDDPQNRYTQILQLSKLISAKKRLMHRY